MQTLSPKIDPRYGPLVLFLICLLASGLLFNETAAGLWARWRVFDESYGHGLLVGLCCMTLCGRALLQPGVTCSTSSWYPIPVLVLLSGLVTIANTVGVEILPQLLLPFTVWLTFAVVAGFGPARRIVIPLGLLYFAVPIWDYLNDGLVVLTSRVVGYMVGRSSIPAYITGNSIFLPAGEIIIASGCSGLRYLIIGMFLGVLGSYLNFVSWRREAVLLAGFLFVSLLANWLRVYGITIVAYFSEMQHPLIRDHEFAGWVVFMVCISPLLYAGARLRPVSEPVQAAMETSAGQAGWSGMGPRALYLLVVSLALISGPVWLGQDNSDESTALRINDLVGPVAAGWIESSSPASEWQPRVIEPSVASVQQFVRADDRVGVFQYLYTRSASRQEIVPYISDLYDRDNWAIESSAMVQTYRVLGLVNKLSQKRIRVAYRFTVGGLVTSNYLVAKLYQFPALFLHRPYALLTAVVAECDNTCELADRGLTDFLEGR